MTPNNIPSEPLPQKNNKQATITPEILSNTIKDLEKVNNKKTTDHKKTINNTSPLIPTQGGKEEKSTSTLEAIKTGLESTTDFMKKPDPKINAAATFLLVGAVATFFPISGVAILAISTIAAASTYAISQNKNTINEAKKNEIPENSKIEKIKKPELKKEQKNKASLETKIEGSKKIKNKTVEGKKADPLKVKPLISKKRSNKKVDFKKMAVLQIKSNGKQKLQTTINKTLKPVKAVKIRR